MTSNNDVAACCDPLFWICGASKTRSPARRKRSSARSNLPRARTTPASIIEISEGESGTRDVVEGCGESGAKNDSRFDKSVL